MMPTRPFTVGPSAQTVGGANQASPAACTLDPQASPPKGTAPAAAASPRRPHTSAHPHHTVPAPPTPQRPT